MQVANISQGDLTLSIRGFWIISLENTRNIYNDLTGMMGSTRGSCSKIAELFRLVKWFNLPRAMLRLYMDIVNIFLYILDILLTLSKDRRWCSDPSFRDGGHHFPYTWTEGKRWKVIWNMAHFKAMCQNGIREMNGNEACHSEYMCLCL